MVCGGRNESHTKAKQKRLVSGIKVKIMTWGKFCLQTLFLCIADDMRYFECPVWEDFCWPQRQDKNK